jgi:enoyl-CoA hydratase/carnithine racemase
VTTAGATYRRSGDLLEITFDRPERRNALGAAEWIVLDEAIAQAEVDATCEFVVIRGEGDVFCAGIDLKQIESARESGDLLGLMERNGGTLQRLEALPQIVIVVLNGPAIGIGTHIALCADVVMATEAAYLWIPEARLGIPDVLHYRTLERRIGRSAAFSMMLLGDKLAAQEAKARGLVAETFADRTALNAGAENCLTRLRAVAKPVRAALKSYATSINGRSDPGAQLAAAAAVLGAGVAP